MWARLSRKWKRNTSEGQAILAYAYRAVFKGEATQNQREMVLADLAANCNWNQITPPETGEQRIWFNEGKRAAFASIFAYLSLSPNDVAAFENAVRHDAAAMYDDANQ